MRRLLPHLCTAALVLSALGAQAKPPAPSTFCAKYPTAATCTGAQPACSYCHLSPPLRNVYGAALEAKIAPGAPRPLSDGDFAAALPGALAAVEAADSDGDGAGNLLEIQKGTQPGDPKSFPNDVPCVGGANPNYTVCKRDLPFTFRKVVLDFCGASPTFEALQAFRALDAAAQAAALDTALDACVASEFWLGKNGQLWRLAHRKIRPVGTLKTGEDQGIIGLADYYDDYALFAWSQTADHDAREVITADFFVKRDVNPTRYSKVLTLGSQKVDTAHRNGNLTSAWTLVYNVMFTAVPRNAASQAYRGYLGLDIAKQEGLYAIPGEPKDYDNKGVTQALCTQCHATLDPLSYVFTRYHGLTGPNATYDANRLNRFAGEAPNILQTPEAGAIFGKPVANLREWAQAAANSDAFASATVLDYWKLLMGAGPTPEQSAEFIALWKAFRDPAQHNYRVEKMLHALIHTEAYGAP
jgi:hypothetical protein